MKQRTGQRGFTVLETLIGIAILSIVSTAVYFSYSNILDIVQAAQYNNAALSIMESNVESVRNMRYEDIGVIGGAPAGLIPQVTSVTLGTTTYTLHTYVRNIDDSFDGTLGGTPNDTAPADYKLVEFQVTCDSCTRYRELTMATYVAPKNLESASKNGNLFVRVLDASGIPLSGVTVRVTNNKVTPAIDLTDTTNTNGILQLVGIATSSSGYHLVASKTGYSTDQTYPIGAPANPVKPDATVANQQLTISTLAIDALGSLRIQARTAYCQNVPSFDFLITGAQLIGTKPDVPKYSVPLTTDTNGSYVNQSLEWDFYSIRATDASYDLAATVSSLSFSLAPSESKTLSWMLADKSSNSTTLSVVDQSGTPISGATVRVTGTSYDQSRTTSYYPFTQTTWASNEFTSKSTLMSTATPGLLTLGMIAGSYASASNEWLISNTIDLGTSSTSLGVLRWSPIVQPPTVGTGALQIQIAGNSDNATWNWVGPDGTPGTFFSTPGQLIPESLRGSRYLRYRVVMDTADVNQSPQLDDISLEFSSDCVPLGQVYFNGLALGSYTVTISHPNYQAFTGTLVISSDWSRSTFTLLP